MIQPRSLHTDGEVNYIHIIIIFSVFSVNYHWQVKNSVKRDS